VSSRISKPKNGVLATEEGSIYASSSDAVNDCISYNWSALSAAPTSHSGPATRFEPRAIGVSDRRRWWSTPGPTIPRWRLDFGTPCGPTAKRLRRLWFHRGTVVRARKEKRRSRPHRRQCPSSTMIISSRTMRDTTRAAISPQCQRRQCHDCGH